MNPIQRLQQIRRELELPSRAQVAWQSLTRTEKKAFINLAGLTAYESVIFTRDFDEYPQRFQIKINQAIQLTANIARKFNAKIAPKEVVQTKQLKAVA